MFIGNYVLYGCYYFEWVFIKFVILDDDVIMFYWIDVGGVVIEVIEFKMIFVSGMEEVEICVIFVF